MKIIAHIHTDFPQKFGIPRQSGLVESLKGTIVFEPEYRSPDAVKGMEDYDYLWLLWKFQVPEKENWSATVKPPRLGGNTAVGVFATRSPFRPNPIGLSSVRLEKVELTEHQGPVIHVSGVDLRDGTPIYDIKPYLPYVDCHPEAVGGFADEHTGDHVEVIFPEAHLCRVPEELRETLIGVLSQDPRPAYQRDPDRVYGFAYADLEVRFTVSGGTLTVVAVEPAGT